MKDEHVPKTEVWSARSGAPVPLARAKVSGWIKVAFWGLRLYIAVMVLLVIVGFAHGTV